MNSARECIRERGRKQCHRKAHRYCACALVYKCGDGCEIRQWRQSSQPRAKRNRDILNFHVIEENDNESRVKKQQQKPNPTGNKLCDRRNRIAEKYFNTSRSGASRCTTVSSSKEDISSRRRSCRLMRFKVENRRCKQWCVQTTHSSRPNGGNLIQIAGEQSVRCFVAIKYRKQCVAHSGIGGAEHRNVASHALRHRGITKHNRKPQRDPISGTHHCATFNRRRGQAEGQPKNYMQPRKTTLLLDDRFPNNHGISGSLTVLPACDLLAFGNETVRHNHILGVHPLRLATLSRFGPVMNFFQVWEKRRSQPINIVRATESCTLTNFCAHCQITSSGQMQDLATCARQGTTCVFAWASKRGGKESGTDSRSECL